MNHFRARLDRREFLRGLTGWAAVATTGQLFFGEHAYSQELFLDHPFSVQQGLTTTTDAQLSVDLPAELEVTFRLVSENTAAISGPASLRSFEFPGEPWVVHHLQFTDLNPADRYYFQIVDAAGLVLDERILKSLDLAKANPRLALISCMRDSIRAKKEMWEAVYEAKPDLLFFLGDNVYVDHGSHPTAREIWRRYIETRLSVPYYHMKSLIPSLATWDDHDYGVNNGDGNFERKQEALKIFGSFFAQNAAAGPTFERGPGVSSAFRAFGMQFLLLDDRYERSEKRAKNGSPLGAHQQQWALRQLSEFEGPTWLMQGTQFFGGGTFGEAYERRFRADLHQFLDGIRATERRVLFASGDVHRSEISDIEPDFLGFSTYELTSSCLHSRTWGYKGDNERRRQMHLERNFLLVEPRLRGELLEVGVGCIAAGSRLRFTDTLRLGLG